jgi:hypothetical protein
MLDARYYLPAIGFAFRRGGRGYWIKQGINFSYLSSIEYPVSFRLEQWNYNSDSRRCGIGLPVSRFGGIRAGKAELRLLILPRPILLMEPLDIWPSIEIQIPRGLDQGL